MMIVFASVLPGALLMGGLLHSRYLQGRERIDSSTRAMARAMARVLDERLAAVQAALRVLATSRQIALDMAEFRVRAAEVQSQQGLAVVGLVDRQGRAVMNTLQPLGTQSTPGSAAHIGSVFTTGKPVATNLFHGVIHRPYSIAVAVPVMAGGQVAYALVGDISPTSIRDLLLQQKLPEGWVAAVVDRSGTIVARTSEHEKFIGVKVRDSLLHTLEGADEGSIDSQTLTGVPVLTAFSKAPISGWHVVIGVPKEQLTAELLRDLTVLAFGTLAVLGGGTVVALFLSRSVGQTLRQLIEQANRLGRGEQVERIETKFVEADALAWTLQHASEDMRKANETLMARDEDLARTNMRLTGLVDSAMDGIVSADETHQIVIFNPAAERIFGWRADEVMGRPLAMLIPAAHRDGHDMLMRGFVGTGSTSRRMGDGRVVQALHRNGGVFPIEAAISHLDMGQGKLYTAVVRDVTEREQAREELALMAAEAGLVREQEKARIARELHDELAQSLAVLHIDLNALQAGPDTGPELRASIARMQAVVASSVAATRRIAADLRPVVLDDLGLPAAIEWLADEFSQRTGVPCSTRIDPGLDLPEPYATGIFRIVQETLSNAAKHARARQVDIRAERTRAGVLLTVQDDGVGFDVSAARKPLSLGLSGLRERVRLLRGQLRLHSETGRGTRIEVEIVLTGA